MSSESILSACNRAVLTARGGDPRVGLRIASDAYKRAQAEGSRPAMLAALNAVAVCQSINGAHINSLGTAIDAYRVGVELGDRRGALHAMLSFAYAAIEVFHVPVPGVDGVIRRCGDEAIALADPTLQVRVQNALGAAHMVSGDFSAQLHAYERALALVPRTDGTMPASLLLGNIANAAVRLVLTAQAGNRAERVADANRRLALALSSSVEDKAVVAELRAHANGGWLRQIEGRHEEALEWFRRALSIALRIRHHTNVAWIKMQMADSFTAMGRDAEAAAECDSAYAVAGDVRPSFALQEVCNRGAAALERMGDHAGAARMRVQAAEERALYDRELAHARRDFERFLEEVGTKAA